MVALSKKRGSFSSLVLLAVFVSILGLACFTEAQAQPVRDRVLSRVQVSEIEDCAIVSISFNYPVQATSVFPKDRGDHVRIELNLIDTGRIDGDALRSREELRPPSNRNAGIQEIRYTGDAPTGPELSILFTRNRYFDVKRGSDFRSLDIRVADNPVADACSGKAPKLKVSPEIDRTITRPSTKSILRSMPETLDENALYVLNLHSKQTEIKKSDLPDLKVFSTYAAYVTRFEKDGLAWNRLRIGFFKTRKEALNVATELKQAYPEAWIVKPPKDERETVVRAWLSDRGMDQKKKIPPAQSSLMEELPSNGDAAALVTQARALMAGGDYARAIQLLTKALIFEENNASPEAREMLGLAREKNGQLAHAKAEYSEYIKNYPEGEGAARVRQRLSALLTAGKEAPPELRGSLTGKRKPVTRMTASLSQFYQRDESILTLDQPNLVSDPDSQVNRNALVSGADVTASISNDRFDGSLRFSGTHTKDFLPEDNNDFGAVSALFIDIADRATRLAARFGRQTRSTGGVLGRFDGGLVSFDVTEEVRLNVVAGAPVIRSRNLFVDDSRHFLGASVDVNQFVKNLDTTVYFIHQKVGSLVDRQAVGLEMRYVDDHRSAFGLLDYDVFYGSLNLALFNGSWRLKDNTTFNVALDYRYAPSLMTIDALQGQGLETIDMLRGIFTDDEIYQIAEARAARIKTGSFTVSHPLSDKFQVNGSVTLSKMEPTIAAGGVEGQPGTGVEAFYSAQLLGTNLLMDGDLMMIGFRYDDMASAQRYVIDLNSRFRFNRTFRINPRLRFSKRNSTTVDQTQFTIKPSIRLNYIPTRFFQLDLEAGGEWIRTNNAFGSETIKGYFFIGGYRLDF